MTSYTSAQAQRFAEEWLPATFCTASSEWSKMQQFKCYCLNGGEE